MVFQLVPFITVIGFLTEFLFPLWKTFRMLFNRTKNDEVDPSIAQVERVQWTMYWIQFAIVRWLLSFPFSQLIVNNIPLFREAKLLVSLWLLSPKYQGAAWLWYNVLENRFTDLDDIVTDFVETRMQTLFALALGRNAMTPAPFAVPSKDQDTRETKYVNATTVSGPSLGQPRRRLV